MTHLLPVPLEWAPIHTHTDTHTPSHDRYIFPLIQSVVCSMNVYSMFPFLGMFHSAAAVMFKKKKKKEFPLVFLSLCMCVCVCECRRACEHVLAGRHVIDSSLHLQAISGLRSHRPCKQPQASFPASFTCYILPSLRASLSTFLPPSFGFSNPSSSG